MDTITPPSTTHHRALAAIIHLLGLVTSVFGPLLAWALCQRSSQKDFLIQQAIEAVNFQLTAAILFFICKLLSFILIGLLFFPFVALFYLIFPIIAAIHVSKGSHYRYPYAFPLIRP